MGLPSGYSYRILENSLDYDPSYKVTKTSDGSTVQSTTATDDTIILTPDTHHTVAFTNTNDSAVPSGVPLDTSHYAGLFAIGILGLYTSISRRHRLAIRAACSTRRR